MRARVYLWDNRRQHLLYHHRMCRLPSNTPRKRVDNSREGRDLSKHIPHLCLTTSHMHTLRINTMVLLTALDTFRNLSSSTRPYFNLGHQDQDQPTIPLQNNPVETFNRKPILTIKLCINKGVMMITSPTRITRNINTNIRIALG